MQRFKQQTDAEREAILERRRAANRKRMQMKRMDPRYRQHERERRARTGGELNMRNREMMRQMRLSKKCGNGADDASYSPQYDHSLCFTDGNCSFCGIAHSANTNAGLNSCCCILEKHTTKEVESVYPVPVSIKSEPGQEAIQNSTTFDEYIATDIAGLSENRLTEPRIDSSTIQKSTSSNLPIAATVDLPELKENKPVQEASTEKQKKLVYPLKSYEKICSFQNSAPADQSIITTDASEIKGNTFVNGNTDVCIDPCGTLCYIHDSYIYKDTVTFMGRFMITCKVESCPAWGVLVKKIIFLSMGHTHEPAECDADKIKLYSILKNCGSTEKLPYNFQVNTRKTAVDGACENIILLLLKHLKDLRTTACTKELVSKLQHNGYQTSLPEQIDYTNFMSLYENLPKFNIVKENPDTSTPFNETLSTDATAKQAMTGIGDIKTEAFERYSRINDEPLTGHEKGKLKQFIFEHLVKGDGDLGFVKVEEDENSTFSDESGDFNDFESFMTIKKESDDSCNKDSCVGLNFESEFSITVKDEENQETLYLMHIKHEPDEMESDFIW